MYHNLLFYFIIYSFMGWILESVFKTIKQRKLINSGFLHGPVCPIYGFGAIIMILLLGKISDNIIILFIASTIILTIWEYIVGVILEKVFKTKYWDYSHLKFNIKGRICLKNSIYWGILGVAFTVIIHPFIMQYVQKIPTNILIYINIGLYALTLTDATISVIKILFIDKKLQRLAEINEMIKEKIQELKQVNKPEKYKENIQRIITDLKLEQTKIKTKLYKLATRLKTAFPTMQSEAINNFIAQRKEDIQSIKDKIKNKEK